MKPEAGARIYSAASLVPADSLGAGIAHLCCQSEAPSRAVSEQGEGGSSSHHSFSLIFLQLWESSWVFSPLLFLWNGEAERVPAWQVRGALVWLPLTSEERRYWTSHLSLVPGGVVGVHSCRIHVVTEG